MVVGGSEPSALYQWVATNGQVVYFFAQLVYWMFVGVAAAWAAIMYTRYVIFVTGGGKPAEATGGSETGDEPAEASGASVDEFVE